MALLMVRNLIQNGHQDGRHLGFYLKFIFIGKMLKLPLVVFSRVENYDTINHFAAFGCALYVFAAKKCGKHAFLFKIGLKS